MNKGDEKWSSENIRGDHIIWISNHTTSSTSSSTTDKTDDNSISNNHSEYTREKYPSISDLVDKLHILKDELSTSCNLVTHYTTTQLARYPENGHYVRHKDAFFGSSSSLPSRQLTVIYYLNPAWTEEQQGCLRLFCKKEEHSMGYEGVEGVKKGVEGSESYLDVLPLMDRLIVFQSKLIDHEVRKTLQPRFAATMWIY
eukprot:TRINITY_DN7228_c0_g1_i5.p1 TRINITY_DN7228_c0_g1~~TRINITY_DN7228_c0_g1_i5.p1  ORF type:complete len:199 (+),score=47.77 TRINITY_DN7228_c0_g1_i5:498-1094(+)